MKKRSTPRQSADVANKTASDVTSEATLFTQLKNVLLVVGAPLIIFAAFRNSLTWHLQRFWGASGDFWQGLWDRLVDTIGEDEFTYYFYGTLVVTTAVYWIWGTMFTLLDVTLKPAALRKYKIQPGTNEPVDSKRLRKVMGVVIFNQIFVNIPMAFVGFYLSQWRGIPSIRELPSFHRVLFELVICLLMEEVGFYYSHRLLHQRSLYRYIHKLHHEWTSPIGWAALYAHPVEYAVSNIAPLFAGPLLAGSHIATHWLWFVIGIINTVNSHSGYHLPFASSPEAHDFHHLKFTQCYGVLGILDRLHKTDTLFRNSGVIKRHKILKSLTPMRELYPLSDKGKTK